MIRILGIDPGSNITGFGIIERTDRDVRHIQSGCIVPPKNLTFTKRLLYIYETLLQVIKTSSPTDIAIEDSFVSLNAKSSLKLGQTRGVALLAAVQEKIPIYEYPPTQVKIAISGYGRASKEQVQDLVMSRLKISDITNYDATDALAVAICHSQSLALRKIIR